MCNQWIITSVFYGERPRKDISKAQRCLNKKICESLILCMVAFIGVLFHMTFDFFITEICKINVNFLMEN